MECAQCGAELKGRQANCASCGAAVQRDVPDSDEIHRLLAEANLLRIRKQFDEAVSVCTRILRLDAANATAHSLMGDIHRDEGNEREALGWYKLAVQLNANNPADRKKLDEMIDRVFQQSRQGGNTEEPGAEEETAPTENVNRFPQRLRALFAKITPTHVIIAFSVVAAVVVLLILNPIFQQQKHQTTNTSTNSSANDQGDGVVPAPDGLTPPAQAPQVVPPGPNGAEKIPGLPLIITPNSKDKPADKGGQGVSRPPANASPNNVVSVPAFEPPGKSRIGVEELEKMTAQLRGALEEAARASKLKDATLDDVAIDPRSTEVTITYSIPHMLGPTETKQGLLYMGFHLIWAADKVDARLKSFALHGFAYPVNGKAPSLALQADVSTQQADEARSAGDYPAVARYLSNAWWRDDLEPAAL